MIVRRKFRREADAMAPPTTHKVQIGTRTGERKLPQRLPGFVIMRDSLDENQTKKPDFQAMERLGYTVEQLREAWKLGIKGGPDLLPQRLEILIEQDAIANAPGLPSRWRYDGLYDDSYVCQEDPAKEAKGLFCRGNGETATRAQPDGTSKIEPCVPYGSSDDASQFCPFSQPGPKSPCKLSAWLTFALLYRPSGHDGPADNLLSTYGARARFSTTSEYGALAFVAELDRAADLLGGHIRGLIGELHFQKKMRRQAGGGSAPAPLVILRFNDAQIAALRAERNQAALGMVGGAQAPLALPEPARAPELPVPRVIAPEAGIYRGDIKDGASTTTGPVQPADATHVRVDDWDSEPIAPEQEERDENIPVSQDDQARPLYRPSEDTRQHVDGDLDAWEAIPTPLADALEAEIASAPQSQSSASDVTSYDPLEMIEPNEEPIFEPQAEDPEPEPEPDAVNPANLSNIHHGVLLGALQVFVRVKARARKSAVAGEIERYCGHGVTNLAHFIEGKNQKEKDGKLMELTDIAEALYVTEPDFKVEVDQAVAAERQGR